MYIINEIGRGDMNGLISTSHQSVSNSLLQAELILASEFSE
jgi:hypothetical protein